MAPSFPSCSVTGKAKVVPELFERPSPAAGPSSGGEGSRIPGTSWSLSGALCLGHQLAEGPFLTSQRNQPHVVKTRAAPKDLVSIPLYILHI